MISCFCILHLLDTLSACYFFKLKMHRSLACSQQARQHQSRWRALAAGVAAVAAVAAPAHDSRAVSLA